MKNIIIIIISFLIHTYSISAKDNSAYDSANIPTNLLTNANAVIRASKTTVNILSDHLITVDESVAITILNREGLKNAILFVNYDNFSEIVKLDGKIYDSKGQLVRNISKNEISDITITSKSTVYSDSRGKYIQLYQSSFPFTVEFTYKKKINGYINPPLWSPVRIEKVSLEIAELNIAVNDPQIKLLYKNLKCSPLIESSSSISNKYSSVLRNFRAIIEEDDIPPDYSVYPAIIYSTNKFQLDNNTGSAASWQEFGNFFYKLSEGTDILSGPAIIEIKSLVNNISGRKEKTKKLYQWMQEQIRYVSIQKGIGGWKPSQATSVFVQKIGDCKGLVNFLKAALQAIEINAFTVLVSSGINQNHVFSELPFNYFNHVILCVPNGSDSIWLECTDKKQPFNYVGDFTSDRKGLLLNGLNSSLVNTPVKHMTDNLSSIYAVINIDSTGFSTCTLNNLLKGELQDRCRMYLFNGSVTEKDKWLHSELAISDFYINNYEFKSTPLDIPESGYTIILESRSIASISQSRLFISPMFSNFISEALPENLHREFPLQLSPDVEYSDTIIINYPSEFVPETKNKTEKLENEYTYFSYDLSFNDDSKKIQLIRKLRIRKYTILPDNYAECIEIRNKIMTLSNKSIVMKHL